MKRAFRVLDSGLQSGPANHAIDRYFLELHAQGACSDLLRFFRSLPCASVGRHQVVDRELRLDYCLEHGIAPVRRISGGGAIYQDPGQLGWSLIVRRIPAWQALRLEQVLAQTAEALVVGLRRLDIEARYVWPNDLEIDGRKIGSLFAAGTGESLLLQGTLLLDVEIQTMLETLRVPTEKLSPDGLSSARARLVTVKECLGVIPDIAELQSAILQGLSAGLNLHCDGAVQTDAVPALPCAALTEEYAAVHLLDWRSQEAMQLEAMWKTRGGTLRARASFDHVGQRFGQVEIGGDVQLYPDDLLRTLGHMLQDQPIAAMPDRVAQCFCEQRADTVGFGESDLVRLLQILLDKRFLHSEAQFSQQQLNALMVYSPEAMSAQHILSQASVMLVPYCAKPVWCKWRTRDGCPECGLCEVGEAYRLARERGMQVTTVTHYEHLVQTLTEMKAREVKAYVGMCCSSFFIKRHRAFQQAGMPALLMDISGSNCYELKQEELAYAGQFQAEARLDKETLQQVIQFVPHAGQIDRKQTI